ncbi:PREDICTED: uncharacterized protein LOC109241678 [Nicotiana attenuata]|uniref:Serine-rich protein-like protein n=1 Tax=Nicotiana attenuata TaxID=49451 RepID=A0A314L574_NICAT|nr:PREDICTED: uncharacterized protein LOC109241678 [Nicotiana attenuata]OIT36746.1 hypothetical protein A4A49_04557 [Nicotiana attenuata]
MAVSARRSTGPVLRSLSPAERFYSSNSRTTSSSASSIRFSLDRESSSPSRSISVMNRESTTNRQYKSMSSQKKMTCMCSPTTHPGSYRCSMHKKTDVRRSSSSTQTVSSSYNLNSNRLYTRRSAMTNSLVRLGTVEGELVKRALAALIRPSSHQQRRRYGFQRRPSRLSNMYRTDDSAEC